MSRPVSISRQEITDLLRCVQWDNPNSMRDKARIVADREGVSPADVLTLVIGQDDWGIVHQLAQYGARNVLTWLYESMTMRDEPGNREMILGARTRRGETGISIAARSNQPKIIEDLLMRGFGHNIMDRDHMGFNPLHLAARHGSISALGVMLQYADANQWQYDFRMDARTPSGETVLHIAARRGDLEMARVIIEQGVDTELTDMSGSTALHAAVDRANPEMTGFLLDMGASPYTPNREGLKAEELAIRRLGTSLAQGGGGIQGVISQFSQRRISRYAQYGQSQSRGRGRGQDPPGHGSGRGPSQGRGQGWGGGSGRGF